MKAFIEYLQKENVIATLIDDYNIKEEKDIFLITQIINKLSELNTFASNSDNIGTIYEACIDQTDRKALGEFYTPTFIVNYILSAVGYDIDTDIENKKIIDISCGSGSFLIQAVKRLIRRLKKVLEIRSMLELSSENGKYIVESVKKSIFGVDINPVAVVLCQINIQFALFEIYESIKRREKNYSFPKFKIFNRNAFELILSGDYDYVTGNPPYLFIRDVPKEQKLLIEQSNFETCKGQYDLFQIFIEIGIKLLKNRGYFGYVVPDSLLALSNRSIIRKYVYDTTNIKEIYHIGPKFDDPVVSNIILILQKESELTLRERNLIKIKLQASKTQHSNKLVQKIVKKWDYKFLINLSSTDIKILEHMNTKFPKIRDLMNKSGYTLSLSRGVELGKDGKVIYCMNCKKYYPFPRKRLKCQGCNKGFDKNEVEVIIANNIPKKNKENYELFAHSINRYRINGYKYINVKKSGINYKELGIYEDRIIIRQLSENNLICAAIDKKLSLTSQSFYNFKIVKAPTLEFNNYYLLGLINSQLLSYHFIKSFGSYKILFPRILIEKIKQLPIKILEINKEKEIALKIVENVKILIESNEKKKSFFDKIQKKIDSMVFDLYQIPIDDKEFIKEFMKTL